MSHIEFFEDAGFIKAILNTAILDAFNYKKPKKPKKFTRPIGSKKKDNNLNPQFVSTDLEYLAWDARRFLRTDNILFCYYCGLVDIDPEYLAEKVARATKIIDSSKINLTDNVERLSELIINSIKKDKIKRQKLLTL